MDRGPDEAGVLAQAQARVVSKQIAAPIGVFRGGSENAQKHTLPPPAIWGFSVWPSPPHVAGFSIFNATVIIALNLTQHTPPKQGGPVRLN